ncbi:MAG: hypothetical protein ACR2RB_02240 [Gammaproteobacteria bacterium]
MATESLDTQLTVMATRLDHVDNDVGHMRSDISELRRTTITLFLWVMGVVIASSAAIFWRLLELSSALTQLEAKLP